MNSGLERDLEMKLIELILLEQLEFHPNLFENPDEFYKNVFEDEMTSSDLKWDKMSDFAHLPDDIQTMVMRLQSLKEQMFILKDSYSDDEVEQLSPSNTNNWRTSLSV